jgi:hypothetical protein
MAYPFAAAEVLTAVDLNAMIGAPTQNAITTVTYTAVLLDAGKTVTLSNASAVTLTIPAQASVSWADNTQLNFLNIGAGTVTITPAVDVTINGTPLTLETSKGGSLVRTASNTWTFTPNGGDSPGLNPVAPTSIANSGGSASTTGNTTTFSAVTSLSLNGVFTSGYTNYRILFNASGSADVSALVRFRTAGTDATGANYTHQLFVVNNSTISGNRISSATSGTMSDTFTTAGGGFVADVFSPALTSHTYYSSNILYNTSTFIIQRNGTHALATSYDGFTIFPESGNITGTITVYGYAK